MRVATYLSKGAGSAGGKGRGGIIGGAFRAAAEFSRRLIAIIVSFACFFSSGSVFLLFASGAITMKHRRVPTLRSRLKSFTRSPLSPVLTSRITNVSDSVPNSRSASSTSSGVPRRQAFAQRPHRGGP